jgi:hypothetical protein
MICTTSKQKILQCVDSRGVAIHFAGLNRPLLHNQARARYFHTICKYRNNSVNIHTVLFSGLHRFCAASANLEK